MIKQNDKREMITPLNIITKDELLNSEDQNPFKRKPTAENQVIEEGQIPNLKLTSIDNIQKTSLEFMELEVNEARERIKNISILEFDCQKFKNLAESSGSNY